MAEKRSMPAALGIIIGPAIAYLSYWILAAGLSEFWQLLCFGVFALAGYDLAKNGLSLSGVLAILLVPALPIAMYLNAMSVSGVSHLQPAVIIGLWAASVLLGAIAAGLKPSAQEGSARIKRLLAIAIGLLLLIVASFIF